MIPKQLRLVHSRCPLPSAVSYNRYPQRDPLLRPLFLRLLFRFSRRSDVSGVTIGAAEDTDGHVVFDFLGGLSRFDPRAGVQRALNINSIRP